MPEANFFEQEITLSPLSEPAGLKFPAKLAYRTFGDPSDPAILLPTCFNGNFSDTALFLYSTQHTQNPLLPPEKYFIILTGLLGGGESSSPSNTPAPFHGPNFPRVSYENNVRMQYSLCHSLGVKNLFAYIGFSMGGQQAYHMSVLYPDFVQNMVCLAGSARTSMHNWCLLEGLKYTLTQSSDFHDGNYGEPVRKGLKAFDRVYTTWALSPGWYRQRYWEQLGFTTLEEYLDEYWSGSGDANDVLLQLWTWQHGDITLCYQEDEGHLWKTLGRIKARCLIMPSRTDQCFPPENSEEEVKYLKHGDFRCIESVYGHLAGGADGTKEDSEYIIQEIGRFLGLSSGNI